MLGMVLCYPLFEAEPHVRITIEGHFTNCPEAAPPILSESPLILSPDDML